MNKIYRAEDAGRGYHRLEQCWFHEMQPKAEPGPRNSEAHTHPPHRSRNRWRLRRRRRPGPARPPALPPGRRDPGEGTDFPFCLARTAVRGMMGNVVRGARPPPRPQAVSESVGVSGATPESRRRAEEGKRTGQRGGEQRFKTPAGKRKEKKVEVSSFLPSHFANFGGRPQRGNVTQTSLSEIEFAFVFAEDFTRPVPHPAEGLGRTQRRAPWV